MSDTSKIQWTDATWNPVGGCSMVAPGCMSCYAIKEVRRMSGNPNPKIRAANEGLTERMPNGKLNWTGLIRPLPDRLAQPLRRKEPTKFFVNSLSDLFHEDLQFEYIAACFGIMAACADRNLGHVHQVLTKRPEIALEFFRWLDGPSGVVGLARQRRQSILHESVKFFMGYDNKDRPAVNLLRGWPLLNVWIGTSIANQADADKNIPILLQVPAAIRFLSVEPMIGPVDLSAIKHVERIRDSPPPFDSVPVEINALTGAWVIADGADSGSGNRIDWVIVGGESGPNARPCELSWIESVVAQCRAVQVPVFVKQLGTANKCSHDKKGGHMECWPEHLRIREFPNQEITS